ncbi:ABC transporter ATP-binding protein [Campylobacter volucris]|uniref:ABC transporter ATP-binding protein n=1 Tax=Campylobacter volucris TaxID=1031542 RepID=UPI00189FC29F|nr:ABC transporter ATP-binding protein [Campylobacter volucris]MBF7042079.1 ABC transporter ATP-binding protein [Campylobacter volucris]MBF7069501.1 ABC transporter ATP-binding protein [Campylobacter volucris]
MLKIKDLNFKYKDSDCLKNINLHINNGDFLGILGTNGSGKSTLMKNMLKILHPYNGEIEFLDLDLKKYSIKEYSKHIGFLPQNSNINVSLKVIDILLMGKYANLKYFFSNYSKKDCDDVYKLASSLKIDKFLQRDILSLSGGEFQKVLLARALLKKPKILFLDEPTSALDISASVEILSLCEELVKDKNIAVVAILHDINLASLFCNKLIFLKNGIIKYKGFANELLNKEVIRDIYNINCEIINQNNKKYILISKEKL